MKLNSKSIETIMGRQPLSFYIRPNTTDEKVIDEVINHRAYQNKNVGPFGFEIEPSDVWLDLGANIGTFTVLVMSQGAKFYSFEPEPSNFKRLLKNIELNKKFNPVGRAFKMGVADSDRTDNLYICSGTYNKYRHSMLLSKNRKSIKIPVLALSTVLQYFPDINAIKMDIEGSEIDILENTPRKYWKNIKKLVFEYSFDVDPSIPRFKKIIKKLEKVFDVVYFTKVNLNDKVYKWYPPQVIVYCLKT